MREIDHEAGVPASGTPSDTLCVEDDDAILRRKLGKSPRGGKTGKTRTNYDPVGFLFSF
jgi:hypothetical protein